MLLAVDVGNTQTVLGLYEGELLTDHWRLATDPRWAALEALRGDAPEDG